MASISGVDQANSDNLSLETSLLMSDRSVSGLIHDKYALQGNSFVCTVFYKFIDLSSHGARFKNVMDFSHSDCI